MRKPSKYILSIASVILVIAAGAILPGEMAAGRDRLILGQVYSEPLDATELSDYVNISMVDKVSLLGQATGVSQLPLKTGAVYDLDSVRTKFVNELEKLHALKLCPLDTEAGPGGISVAAALYIQNDEPAISAILWKIEVRADAVHGEFFMDDQTGKILSFSLSGSGFDDVVYHDGAVYDWAAYLGADVRNIRKINQESMDVEAGAGTAGETGTTGGAGTAGEAGDWENPVAGEDAYRFELYAGSRSVGARMRSFTQSGAVMGNDWELTYLQTNSERIITNE